MLLSILLCILITGLGFVLLALIIFATDLALYRPTQLAKRRARTCGNTTFSADKLSAEVDTIVIGSGPAGLSCAATLAQFGDRVVVFEQHAVVGGGAHTFVVEGKTPWRFDAGLHFTIPPHEQLLQLVCGTTAPPVRVRTCGAADGVSDRIVLGGDLSVPPLDIISDTQV